MSISSGHRGGSGLNQTTVLLLRMNLYHHMVSILILGYEVSCQVRRIHPLPRRLDVKSRDQTPNPSGSVLKGDAFREPIDLFIASTCQTD